jgi:hypothetical protein
LARSRAGQFFSSAQFMTIKTKSHLSTEAIHLLRDHGLDVLTLVGIVATFGIASLIGCAIWLLIW